MTIDQLIEQARQSIADKLAARKVHTDRIEEVRSMLLADNRDPSDAEAAEVRTCREAAYALDPQIAELKDNEAELRAERGRDEAAEQLAREFAPAATRPAYDETARIGQEPRTYSRQTAREGKSWISDAYNATERNVTAARERLERHAREVEVEGEMTKRAVNTGAVAGLIPPQYLLDMAAPVLRAGRPFANLCNHHELPDEGMSVIIPRGTTGSSATAQATENSAVSSTDEAWSNLTVPVCTVAGQAPVSRQALERGVGMDEILFMDLCRAYASQIDNYAINGTGSSGQPLGLVNTSGINAATAFGAAPTVTNVSLKIAGQIAAVTAAGAGIFPNLLVMAGRRWGWFTGQVDTTGRPVVTVNQMGPLNALGLITAPGKSGGDPDPIAGATIIGFHSSGLPILTDLNTPITVGTESEDLILVADMFEQHLWEDGDGSPNQLSFEQTAGNNLTTTLVVYNYMAYTCGRYPNSVGKVGGLDTVGGQGLVAPSF
jgi:HK97 family phage major capsid protein